MKRFPLFLAVLMAFTSVMPLCAFASEKYDNDCEYTIAARDAKASEGITLYPNDTENTRVIKVSDYGFRYSKLMIFDRDGTLIEVGADLFDDVDGIKGSPQFTVNVPPKGFMIAFGNSAPAALRTCYNTVVDGAMFYNSTIPVIFPVFGSYDIKKMTVRIAYNDRKPESKNAKKFLFVGNSSTYFSGTPIQFKGLCDAAGTEIDIDYCTFGSAYLREFADENHERGKKYRSMLNSKKYDYIVFQDAAGADYLGAKDSLSVLKGLADKNGAESLLYMRYAGNSPEIKKYSKKYHDLYTKLAKEFGLKCAPSADAFLKCHETHPEINLHADDNGHHSKAGAYIAACTWLESFLSINPVGNAYRPYIGKDTAKILQETAHDICVNGYDYGEEEETNNSQVIDGVVCENLALNKKYDVDGKVYSGNWTDTGSDGKPMGKFTDGVCAGTEGDSTSCGCYKGNPVKVTIDLGKKYDLRLFSTDLFGNDSWGITPVARSSVKISVSDDGKKFIEAGTAVGSETMTNGNWECKLFNLKTNRKTEGRYVRFEYFHEKERNNFVWLSEIRVFGVEAQDSTEELETGDINGDSKINTSDYTMLKRSVLETYILDENQKRAGDINGDRKITSVDYTMLKRIVLGTYNA